MTTIRESIACENAGEIARQYALFSERYLQTFFAEPAMLDPETFLAATPWIKYRTKRD